LKNTDAAIHAAQQQIFSSGVFQHLLLSLNLEFASNELSTDILCTIGECMRRNPINRKAFENFVDSLFVGNRLSTSAYLSFFISDSTLPNPLRAAALFTLECYLYENENGKDEIVTGLKGEELGFSFNT